MRPLLKAGKDGYEFDIAMELNGSRELRFVPLGRETMVEMRSSWSDPSFSGNYLPEDYDLSDKGLSATWRIPYLSRPFPQVWLDTKHNFDQTSFGVKLFFPADHYQKSTRMSKYSLLFITLAFLAFFLMETGTGRRLHPVQYALIGVAMVIFYLLLLSLSEQVGFSMAYLSASTALIGLVSAYSVSILGSRLRALVVAALMAVLYGYMFVVVQLEDYALLFGSLGVFTMIAATMYFTRKLDWYGLERKAIPGASGTGPSAPDETDVWEG